MEISIPPKQISEHFFSFMDELDQFYHHHHFYFITLVLTPPPME